MLNIKQAILCFTALVFLPHLNGQKLCKPEANPCQNYGLCRLSKDNQETCTCLNRYTGKFCEVAIATREIHFAKSEGNVSVALGCDKCKNGASCSTLNTDKEPICDCNQNFTGKYCERKISPCDSRPCKNNGFCLVNSESNDFTCICTASYTGKTCESISVCSSRPCQNGGYCVNLGDAYTCSCPTEYFGKNCEKKNPCFNKSCSLNGICVANSEDETFVCICSPGYTGSYCNVTDPCQLNPCQNEGICRTFTTSKETTYKCLCLDPYAGVHCETKTNKCVDMFDSCEKMKNLCPIIGLVCRKTCSKC